MKQNEAEEYIQTLVDKHYFSLGEKEILKLNECNMQAGLNNVVVGLDRHCYGVFLIDDSEKIKYQLFYVNADTKLKGDLLKLTADLKYRDGMLLWFSGYLARTYKNLEIVDVYNTFQKHVRGMLERIDYVTITTDELTKFNGYNPELIGTKSKGAFVLRFLDKANFYQDFFRKEGPVNQEVKDDTNYVYLLLNKRNNLFKIGRSKSPKYRERTLQAQEPEIEMIITWEAPIIIERQLHKLCEEKRERGEWFNLSFKELNLIRDKMNEYSSILPEKGLIFSS